MVNKEVPMKIDNLKPILLDKIFQPRTRKSPTLKVYRIVYHSLFELMDKLSLFERTHTKKLYVLLNNCSSFKMVQSLRMITRNFWVN